jgi:ribA/ribD-fused uncharacterized protein
VKQCIDTYKEIVYPNQERIQEFEHKRDVLVEEIKGMEFISPNVFDQLKEILCEIRKLKYKKIDIPNLNTSIIKMPYTFPDLEICESEGPMIDEPQTAEPQAKKLEEPQQDEQIVKKSEELNMTENKNEYVQFYSGSKDKTMQLLSNLAPLNVEYEGKDYPSVEHAYQLMKYKFSEPRDKAIAVMEKLFEESKTLSGKEAVVLGKRKRMEKEGVKLNIQEWIRVSPEIMEALLVDKIQRHPEIRKILEKVKGEGKKLLHYSLRDLEWGGFFTKDKVTGEEGLKGNNELGKIFMKLV